MKLQLCIAFLLLLGTGVYGQSASTELANYIRSGDVERLEAAYSPAGFAGVDEVSGLRPLTLACKNAAMPAIEFLLERQVYYEGKPFVEYGELTPMMMAIDNGHPEVVQLLIDKGGCLAWGNWLGKSYLFHALDRKADQSIVDVLLRNGAKMELAKTEMQQVSKDPEINALARNLTDDMKEQIGFTNRYQEIDVYNLHIIIAEMLTNLKVKYKEKPRAEITRGENGIYQYRYKKLSKILQAEQLAKLDH